MNISYVFKNFEPSEHLKKYTARRMEKLARFIPRSDNVEVSVVMTVDKIQHKIDVQFSGDNVNISAAESSHDMYASVDMVLDKLRSQLKKQGEKAKDKRKGGKGAEKGIRYEYHHFETTGSGKDRRLIDQNHVERKAIEIEEAIILLEDQDNNDFMPFLNIETNSVNVIYKKSDGSYGVISPGFEDDEE